MVNVLPELLSHVKCADPLSINITARFSYFSVAQVASTLFYLQAFPNVLKKRGGNTFLVIFSSVVFIARTCSLP